MARNRSGQVTIRDIAGEVGMSPSTVSRVLNHSRLVDSERAEEIRAAAARLGYTPLRKRRQARRTILNIALILPEESESYLHLFFDPGALMSSIQGAFGDTRINLIAVPDAGWSELFEHKKIGALDGCIIAFVDPSPALLESLAEWSVPSVVLNRIHADTHYVSCDNIGGMRELVVRVLDRARSDPHLHYVDFTRIPEVSSGRREGFLTAARDAGLPDGAVSVTSIERLSEIDDRFFASLGERKVSAIMCFNDVVAMYVYQAALHRGIRIPEDVSLTGFDNSPVRSLLDRRIDTVELGVKDLGATAAGWLRRIIIERSDETLQRILPASYVPGDTIGNGPSLRPRVRFAYA